jgi:Helix-turn-helix
VADVELEDIGTAGADLAPPPPISETRFSAAKVKTNDLGYRRSLARIELQEAGELLQQSYIKEWALRTAQRGRSAPIDLLADLGELGFAWRDVARMVGVSVQAIQKWRRGEGVSGENRLKIASVLAACDLIMEQHGISQIASWFEMPLAPGAPITPLDLWAAGQHDLVFDFASNQVDAQAILSASDPEWRERYRSDFEVFRADDGRLAIRPKGN